MDDYNVGSAADETGNRAIANAQGAVDVVQTASATVDDELAAIEDDISSIRAFRAEQTAMLGEIDDVLATLDAERRTGLSERPALATGIPGFDEVCGGGLIVGGQSVLRYDRDTAVDEAIAQLCATTIAAGTAVSLTPPTLDRSLLADAIAATGDSLAAALEDDRLFVLDMFDTWQAEYNVFDMETTSLAAVNERAPVTTLSDAPFLRVGT